MSYFFISNNLIRKCALLYSAYTLDASCIYGIKSNPSKTFNVNDMRLAAKKHAITEMNTISKRINFKVDIGKFEKSLEHSSPVHSFTDVAITYNVSLSEFIVNQSSVY